MTDKNLSELIIILDRSGSMSSIRDDMEGGFATFIQDRHRDSTRVRVSLYQFDDVYEVVYEDRDAREVHGLALDPRGYTALHDAIGRTIKAVGARLASKSESARPGAVVVMIITDGHENASREYRAQQVRAMIQHQEQNYSWKFMYLGADALAFEEAQTLGINPLRSAKYTADHLGTHGLWAASSNAIGGYYGSMQRGVDAELSIQAQEGVQVGHQVVPTSTSKP